MAKKKQQDETVELGDLARDIITGYEGVVVGVTKHLTGCDRFTLQAQGMDAGKLKEGYNFDVTTVKVVKKAVAIPTMQWTPVDAAPRAVPAQTRPGGPPTKALR